MAILREGAPGEGSDQRTTPARARNGRERADDITRRREAANLQALRERFGAGLRETDAEYSDSNPIPNERLPIWGKEFERSRYIPSAIRAGLGWKPWSDENRATNFLCLVDAATKAGMDRFAAQATAAYVFDQAYDVGTGTGRIRNIWFRMGSSNESLDITIRCELFGDVREEKPAESTQAETTLHLSPKDTPRYQINGLEGSTVDQRKVASSLADGSIGYATFDEATDTVFATRRIEFDGRYGFVPAAFVEARELLTPAEREILYAASEDSKTQARRLKEILLEKAYQLETIAWVDLSVLTPPEREINNLGALISTLVENEQVDIASDLDAAISNSTKKLKADWKNQALAALKDALKTKMDDETADVSGLWRRFFGARVNLSAVHDAMKSSFEQLVASGIDVKQGGTIRRLYLQETMDDSKDHWVYAVVDLKPFIEEQDISVLDPRPGHEKEFLNVHLPALHLSSDVRQTLRAQVPKDTAA